MKKLLIVLILLSSSVICYAIVNVLKVNPTDISGRKDYVGTGIVRYDLGDVECFKVEIGNGGIALSCLRK